MPFVSAEAANPLPLLAQVYQMEEEAESVGHRGSFVEA